MSATLIEARAVSRIIGGEVPATLVNDVSLRIEEGEFVAITGPSGSGKSSLMYLLGLLDKPTKGDVVIDASPTTALDEDARAALRLSTLGFVFQFHFLLPEFSALENVLLPMRALGRLDEKAMRARASALLASLGLADHPHKRPDQMSGGQRQRVAIARALANDPLVILADEPTGNLDSVSSEQVLGIFRDLADGRRTDAGQGGADRGGAAGGGAAGGAAEGGVPVRRRAVVVVTHDLALAARADRRIHIVDGRIETPA